MPLPLIPVAIALIAAGGGGALLGAGGVNNMGKARGIVERANSKLEKATTKFQREWARIQEAAADYGQFQLRVQANTLGAWLRWLEANERKVRKMDRAYVDGVRVSVPDPKALRFQVMEASSILKGGVSAALAAVAAQQAALFGVRTLAVAGTGAAISGLSGAAAESATLAWLGGGTLAAGGAGMAGGAAVLTGFAIAPALLIGGLTLSAQGDKALTQAQKREADVDIAAAELAARVALFDSLHRRIKEMRGLLKSLEDRALRSLAELERVEFDPDHHARQFQQTALLMRAIGEVLETALLDENGELTDDFLTVTTRYSE